MSKVPTFRTQVIKLYRDLIKLSKNWNATNPNLTGVEKDYIREETRKLFKANITISDKHEIRKKLSFQPFIYHDFYHLRCLEIYGRIFSLSYFRIG